MNKKILIFTLVIFIFLYCTQKKDGVKTNESIIAALPWPDSSCLEKKKVMETILNHPDIIRYSKLRSVRKAFDVIFIVFYENDDRNCILPYIQLGDTLKVMNKNDSMNTTKKPVYELKKMAITGDSAYIWLEFDISGAIAYGSLRQIDKQWVPDSTFIMGVR